MKVKLLKNIRKRFSIEYYPNVNGGKFKINDLDGEQDCVYLHKIMYDLGFYKLHPSKQHCIDIILKFLRHEYSHLTRKHKMSQAKTKVWHNG